MKQLDRAPLLRVLHLMGPLRPSGMERMLVSAAEYFRDLGIAGSVYGLRAGSTYEDELRRAGYEVLLGQRPSSSATSAKLFRDWVRTEGFDVIHIHTEADYAQTVAVARWALGSKRGIIVRTIHNNFLASGAWRFKRQLHARVGDRFVSALVAPSEDVASTERLVGRTCVVVRNWVDDRYLDMRRVRKLEFSPNDPPRAVIVGNCSSIKNHEVALRAAVECGFHVAHHGDTAEASERELDLLETLRSSGSLVELSTGPPDASLLTGDVFLLPSLHEGMPVALAEAIEVGIPALAADAPGMRWASQVNGVKLVSSNSVSDWVLELRRIVSAPAAPMSGLIPDFAAERGANEYASIYRMDREHR